MTEWTEHDGKGMPVSPDTKVMVKLRNGWTDEDHVYWETAKYWHEDEPGNSNWCFAGFESEADIVAYRVLSDA